jgi:catechol 2,3-dioxygenase-like lactoylglutathione lyase family enzyme
MKNNHILLLIALAICLSWSPWKSESNERGIRSNSTISDRANKEYLRLGAFSISLNVKDLKASQQFYEKLGFHVLAGDLQINYLIMKNENSLIGLFHGMFENNILTFNPGWDENGKEIQALDDIRVIQQRLKDQGIEIKNEIDADSSGPASLILTDPDGNAIFIDQHR